MWKATPTPNSSGKAMMLAKLIGWLITTQVARVRKPDSTTGARVKATSFRLLSLRNNSRATAISDRMPASMKAFSMVLAAAWIEIGPPEASGATVWTAWAKRTSTRLSLESPFGNTCTRAWPSGASQLRTSSGGRLAWDTVWAASILRIWSSRAPRGWVSVSPTRWRRAAGPDARRSKAVARRAASAAPGWAALGALRSATAAAVRLCTVSASVGAGLEAIGFTAVSSSREASWIRASLAAWSSGTKLERVIAWSTSGSLESRAAIWSAWAREGRKTSMALGVFSGSCIRSLSVDIASLFGFFRCSGLKSKRTSGSRAIDTSTDRPNAPSTTRRRVTRKRSTGANQA